MTRRNPFTPGFGVVPDPFLGRESETARSLAIVMNTGNPVQGNSVLITAQRGMGKTTLMRHVEEEAERAGAVVIRSGGNEGRIIQALQDAIRELLAQRPPRVRGGNVSVMGYGAGITLDSPNGELPQTLESLISLLRRLSGKHHVLFSIDEVNAQSEYLPAFLDEYQIALRDGGIGLIMNGVSQDVVDLLADKKEGARYTFLNRSEKVYLDVLSKDDSIRVIRETLRKSNTSIDENALREYVDRAKGHPYLIQLIGELAWESAQGDQIMFEDLDGYAFERALVKYQNDVLAPIYDAIKRQRGEGASRQQQILFVLARDGASTNKGLAQSLGVPTTSVPPYLEMLSKRALIGKGPNGYQIRYPYLGQYAFDQMGDARIETLGISEEYAPERARESGSRPMAFSQTIELPSGFCGAIQKNGLVCGRPLPCRIRGHEHE